MEFSLSWRRLSLIALASVATCLAVALSVQANGASAAYGPFCPPSGPPNSVTIGGLGRCVHGTYHSNTQQVQAITTNGAGVAHCAANKQYSDGSGGNQGITPACGTAQYQTTGCFPPSAGYATVINQSTSAHKFNGRLAYGQCFP